MTGALWFLVRRTFRNRLVSMARRVKQPRYAIGMLFVVAYFGFMIWGQMAGAKTGMRAGGGVFQNDIVRQVAPAVLALLLLSNWVAGGAITALAFSLPEVAMLFPAPVTRRALIAFKVARAQIPILFNVLIVTLIWGGRRNPDISRWLGAVGLWTMFSTLHLHRIGAALARISVFRHGRSAFRRNWASYVAFLVVAVTMFFVVIDSAERSQSSEPGPVGGVAGQITMTLSTPWVHAVLLPFRLISAPTFAHTTREWFGAFAGALAMLVLHLVWVMRSHAAFEEAAADESTRVATVIDQMRKRGIVTQSPDKPMRPDMTLPLRPVGAPAVAIVWKNALNFLRTFKPTQLLLVLAMPIIVIGYFGWKNGDPYLPVVFIASLLAVVLLLAGGIAARNDLRGDLLNLSSLKTIPLRGSTIVMAEVASSALPLALMQTFLIWVAVAALQMSRKPMPDAIAVSLILTLPIGLAGLNLLTSTIRNGVAVLFPAWVRLGADGGGGIEMMGQTMLALFAMLLGFILLGIAPTVLTLIIVAWLHAPPPIGIAASMLLGSAAAFAESHLVSLWLGRVLERTEPSASLTAA